MMNRRCVARALVLAACLLPTGRSWGLLAALGADQTPATTRPAAAAISRGPTTRPMTRPVVATRPSGIYAFTMRDIDGHDRSLSEFRGKVVLVVNVASRCGFTPQYKGLQKLFEEYKDRGLVIVGVPSNDFHQQEPGPESQIKAFCQKNYGVTFPLLAKVSVIKGPHQAPLYQYLTQKSRNGILDAKVSWNFNKFLIGRDGLPIKHYESKVVPEDPGLKADIEAALRKEDRSPE
jgi:glutathione peroxidase